MDTSMMFILLILIIPFVGFMYWRSRKKKREQGPTPGAGKQTKKENESWTTVKKYLRSKNETGKEIVELFVVKRPDEKDTTNLTKEQKKVFAQNQKNKKLLEKLEKKTNPKAFKESKSDAKHLKKPDLWILYFTTRNPKTGELDEPRILEAQITHQKINKKQTDRVITVNDKINFKNEMEWVLPLKQKEDEQQLKNQKILEKKKQKSPHKKFWTSKKNNTETKK